MPKLSGKWHLMMPKTSLHTQFKHPKKAFKQDLINKIIINTFCVTAESQNK